METFFSMEGIVSFVTLSLLEIVLGIDNLIFIALVADNLPKEYRQQARTVGLALALLIRILMLMSVTWLMGLTEPLITVMTTPLSFKDMLLIGGGVFLIAKATSEMHVDLGGEHEKRRLIGKQGFLAAIFQIAMIDFVFSFDSIITAVGLTQNIYIIIMAVVVSMIVMLAASGIIGHFLERHPTFKMLALSFILMIGVLLTAEGMHVHVPRGYLYFAFAFSIFVEILNTVASNRRR